MISSLGVAVVLLSMYMYKVYLHICKCVCPFDYTAVTGSGKARKSDNYIS